VGGILIENGQITTQHGKPPGMNNDIVMGNEHMPEMTGIGYFQGYAGLNGPLNSMIYLMLITEAEMMQQIGRKEVQVPAVVCIEKILQGGGERLIFIPYDHRLLFLT